MSTFQAYKNKITNKVWGIVHLQHKGNKKGDVLLSYLTEPFTKSPRESFSNFHTMYWECFEMARLYSERGYDVDIVNASDKTFIPKKPYTVCIDTNDNFARFIPHLPHNCKKVFHILISYWKAYNEAEYKRLTDLKNRRDIQLIPRRQMPESKDPELADYLEGFGNKTIFATFKANGISKPIFYIPISAVIHFDFPDTKQWDKAKKHFLWIGGGGAVLKGLDLCLEAFSKTPDLHLHICGPIEAEKDFVTAYKKELYETPNIHTYGRIDIGSKQFKEIIDTCAAVIYPSAGEGSSGAIVQAMHAGLVPLITHETGIQEDAHYIPLVNPTVTSIQKAITDFSVMPTTLIQQKAKDTWRFAQSHYTRDNFSKAYARFIDEILKI